MASAERGLSERALCLNAGLSDSTVKNWRKAVKDNKNPGANEKSLTAIADALGVTRDWLVNGESNGFSEPSGPQPRIDVSRIPDRSEPTGARNTSADTVGTIKIALVDGVLQVAATVDKSSIGKLIRQLETFRAALDDTE